MLIETGLLEVLMDLSSCLTMQLLTPATNGLSPCIGRLIAYWQLIRVEPLVCRLLSLNPGPLAVNVGLRGLLLSLNAGSKSLCLQVEAILFAGYYM